MPTIRLEKATKFFKWEGRTHAAVDEASLQVEQGEFVFLVGSSGAGKSTLLKLVTGELKPDQGVVYLNEMNLARVPAWRRHRGLSDLWPGVAGAYADPQADGV